uniref:Uncharacterized protein n=1 Tax=Arundo donax TaxID=35708 RepID=A0A0A8YDS3_ARUDO
MLERTLKEPFRQRRVLLIRAKNDAIICQSS